MGKNARHTKGAGMVAVSDEGSSNAAGADSPSLIAEQPRTFSRSPQDENSTADQTEEGELPQEEPESVDVETELQSLLDADIDIGEFFGDEVNKASLSDIVQSLKTDFVADLITPDQVGAAEAAANLRHKIFIHLLKANSNNGFRGRLLDFFKLGCNVGYFNAAIENLKFASKEAFYDEINKNLLLLYPNKQHSGGGQHEILNGKCFFNVVFEYVDAEIQVQMMLEYLGVAAASNAEEKKVKKALFALKEKLDSSDHGVQQQAESILANALYLQYAVALPGCAAYLAERAPLIEESQRKWQLPLAYTPGGGLL